MKTEHTKIQYEITYDTNSHDWGICLPSGGDVIAQGIESKETAEFIVRACNSHDKLVEALTELLAASRAELAAWGHVGSVQTHRFTEVQRAAMAAIAKATETQEKE